MIFLGIDPGTAITGYGIIETSGNAMRYRDAGIIKTTPKSSLPRRLLEIYEKLYEKMEQWRPDCVSVEEAFYGKNVRTTLVLGHARGVALLAAEQSHAQVMEFSPLAIKKSVVGTGGASKEQVAYMVKVLLNLPDRDISTDMYDALAASICAFNNFNSVRTR